MRIENVIYPLAFFNKQCLSYNTLLQLLKCMILCVLNLASIATLPTEVGYGLEKQDMYFKVNKISAWKRPNFLGHPFNDELSKFKENISKMCILCARNNVMNADIIAACHLVYECRYYSCLVDYFITSKRCIDENFCISNILFWSTHEIPWLCTFCNVNALFFISFSYQRTRTKLTPTKQILGNALY